MQYFGAKISNNISKREPEGYLYCLNVPIARTGMQKYLASEVGMSGREVVDVHRTPEEVFKAQALASFEGMPVTREHPPEEVDVRNIAAYQKGHVQNVRRGKGEEADFVLADLVITHSELVDDILNNGVRDVSCGYEVEYKQADDGKVYQVGIRGNHVAIVDSGRAGNKVAIRDAANPDIQNREKQQERSTEKVDKKGSVFARMFASFARDEAVKPEEVIEAADELFKPEEAEGKFPKKEETMDRNRRMCDEDFAPQKEEEKKPNGLTFDEGEELLDLIAELAQEVKGLKELVMTKPAVGDAEEEELPIEPKAEEDPLAALEKEVTEGNAGEPLNEGSVTVPPEEVEVEDEDVVEGVEPEPTEGTDEKTREAVVAAIAELKPIIAGLPAQDRKRAADAASRAIRRAAGMPVRTNDSAREKLARVAARKKLAKDSSADENEGRALGERIMKARNPHYRNK